MRRQGGGGTPGQPLPPQFLLADVGARGMGSTAVPVTSLLSSPQVVWLMLPSGVVTTPVPPPVSVPPQPGVSHPLSLFPALAEGAGSPQVLGLSSKVETIKPGCWAALCVWPRSGGHGRPHQGAKLRESPTPSSASYAPHGL